MALSVFDVFKVGIGPSSSHTVGPMRAAVEFCNFLAGKGLLDRVERMQVGLFGSLGATGKGHASDTAVILGLLGEEPDKVDPRAVADKVERVRTEHRLSLAGKREIVFEPDTDLVLDGRVSLPFHPNGMTFTALDDAGAELAKESYYSIGGGFVVDEATAAADQLVAEGPEVPFPFTTAEELMDHCRTSGLSFSGLVLANEAVFRPEEETRAGLLHIWSVMNQCIEHGLSTEGILPGGLNVRRRAPELWRKLRIDSQGAEDPMRGMDWVTLWALAVNEENAAGGRVVTAPTNGASGVIPAVLKYYTEFIPGASEDGIVRFLLIAGAIGIIIKESASISGAEVGCQGEVGSACSMAAGALCGVLGGYTHHIENAAEIGMEHNLGLTCDPIAGLVQIPCIERNAIGAVKAVAAARTALHGDGMHKVTLDEVIKTMRDTGRDMQAKYKETSLGGLAVNVIEC
ncbi:L-serine ammonia-lyase [Granulicoccus sp. GXG6511]|uniref:L-serine ammonia-lyase n=1 Tax=Granulicoccus sp. GXG6511 TaxID=3381351 RepID=UPI003D7D2335